MNGQAPFVFTSLSNRRSTMSIPNRRIFMMQIALAGGAFHVAPAIAVSPPMVDESDNDARGLRYIADASAIEAMGPKHRWREWYAPGRACGNCARFEGNVSDASGGCPNFPGRQVSAKGFCILYSRKFTQGRRGLL
jgi:hypothetical protein